VIIMLRHSDERLLDNHIRYVRKVTLISELGCSRNALGRIQGKSRWELKVLSTRSASRCHAIGVGSTSTTAPRNLSSLEVEKEGCIAFCTMAAIDSSTKVRSGPVQ